MNINEIYYSLPSQTKEDVGFPINSMSMSQKQQSFVEALCSASLASSSIREDLLSVKDDLEDVLERLQD